MALPTTTAFKEVHSQNYTILRGEVTARQCKQMRESVAREAYEPILADPLRLHAPDATVVPMASRIIESACALPHACTLALPHVHVHAHTQGCRACMLTHLSTLVCVCVCVKAFDKHDLLRCSDGSMKSAADVAPLQSLPCVAEGTPADEAALAGRQKAHNDPSDLDHRATSRGLMARHVACE